MTEEKKTKKFTKKSAGDEKKVAAIIVQLDSQHHINKTTPSRSFRIFQYNGKNQNTPLDEIFPLSSDLLTSYIIVLDKDTGYAFCINTIDFKYNIREIRDADDLAEVITDLTADAIKNQPDHIITLLRAYAMYMGGLAIIIKTLLDNE